MPTPSLKDVVANEKYKNLPPSEQNKLLSKMFPQYAGLPENEKLKFLQMSRTVQTDTNVAPPPENGLSLRSDPYKASDNRNATPEEMGITYKPSTMEAMKEELPAGGLATAGAVVGSAGGFPGAIGGAFVGGMLSEGIDKTAEYLSGKRPEDATLQQDVVDITSEGGKQGMYELGGGLAVKGLAKVFAPVAKSVTEKGKVALRTLDKYMPHVRDDKFNLLNPFSWKPISRAMDMNVPGVRPAEMTENWGLDLAQNISKGAVLGGKHHAEYELARDKAVDNMLEAAAESYGKLYPQDRLGEMVVGVTKNQWKQWKKIYTKPLYDAVEDMVKPEVVEKTVKGYVDITNSSGEPLLDAAGKPMRRAVDHIVKEEVGGAKISTKMLKELAAPMAKNAETLKGFGGEETGDNVVNAIMDLPDTIPFYIAQDLKTRLGDVVKKFDLTNKNARAVRAATMMSEQLDDATETALKEYSPEAYQLWQDANRLYREGSTKYNNKFLRKLIRQADPDLNGEPETVLRSIFRNGGKSNINRTIVAIGPDNFRMLKRWYLTDTLKKSGYVPGESIARGTSLRDRLYGPTGMGEDAMDVIFTGEERKALDDIITTLTTIQARQATGQGSMLIQLMQGSAIAGVAGGAGAAIAGDSSTGAGVAAGSLAILAAPEVMARVMLNPIGAKWLSEGFRTPFEKAATERGAAILLRLKDLADRAKEDIDKEQWKE